MNYKDVSIKIERFIKEEVEKRKHKGVLIGLSGGIDSAVVAYLATKALGKDKVSTLCLPYKNQETKSGRKIAQILGIDCKTIPMDETVHHLFDCKYIFDTPLQKGNFLARIRMAILYAVAAKEKKLVIGTTNKSEWEIGYFCYDEQTRALTSEGLKYFNELKKNDTVFSLNLKTKHLQEKDISQLHIFNFDGKMIYGKNKGIDFMITPNHKMVLQDVHNPSKVFLKPLNEYLKNHIHLNIPIPNGWDAKIKKSKLNEFDIKDMMYLYGLFIGDGCCSKGKVNHILLSRRKGSGAGKRNPKTGRFMKEKNQLNITKIYPTYTVQFAIPVDNKGNARQRLEQILTKYNIKYHKAGFGIKTTNRKFYELFIKCGKGSQNKKIPKELLKYPTFALKHLFQGLIDSDGDKQENLYTSSFILAQQFVELCFKIGKSSSIGIIPPRRSVYHKRIINSKRSYIVKVCSKRKSKSIIKNKIQKKYYKGKIWCPEIPENANLLVERNGSFYFCGNTKWGDGAADIEPIIKLYKTEVMKLAKYLKIPREYFDKKPSAGLWEEQTDEEEIGVNYKILDKILQGKIKGINKDEIKRIKGLIKNSEHKRKPIAGCKI